eukprot:3892742-Prymnesium_polylepis.1
MLASLREKFPDIPIQWGGSDTLQPPPAVLQYLLACVLVCVGRDALGLAGAAGAARMETTRWRRRAPRPRRATRERPGRALGHEGQCSEPSGEAPSTTTEEASAAAVPPRA